MTPAGPRWNYYRRIFSAYLGRRNSQLTFWHERPEVNFNATTDELGEYYMTFASKADYPGAYDDAGVPLLDYRGELGLQYNPIAVAQYGLGNYNLFARSGAQERRRKALNAADWLVSTLETNAHGVSVWNHYFDWEYRTTLRAPWYSGLAQGQGISLLLRAHSATENPSYLDAAGGAFESFRHPVDRGGVVYTDEDDNPWIEEYIVSPPTHILNGFLWALWGLHDYYLATGDNEARLLFNRSVATLLANLDHYDIGFWSLYEQSGTRMKMIASPFYHSLHIVQLKVMFRLTGRREFSDWARKWDGYRKGKVKKAAALGYKAAFKLVHY